MELKTPFVALAAAVIALAVTGAAAQTKTAPASRPVTAVPVETPHLIGEAHQQTVGEVTIAFTTTETSFEKIAEVAEKNVGKIMEAKAKGTVKMDGPSIFVYRNVVGIDKPFNLDIGLIVPADSKDAGELKVKKLAEFKCVTVLYTGPLSHIHEVYQKTMTAASDKGLTLTGENRELYLYWEKHDSPNNVVQVQVGVK